MMPSVGSRRKEKPRETRKKRPPRSCNFETAASRACAENHCCNYYTKFPAKCKPQSGRGRGCPPHVLGAYAYDNRSRLADRPRRKLSLGMDTSDPTEGLAFYDEEMEECA